MSRAIQIVVLARESAAAGVHHQRPVAVLVVLVLGWPTPRSLAPEIGLSRWSKPCNERSGASSLHQKVVYPQAGPYSESKTNNQPGNLQRLATRKTFSLPDIVVNLD